MLIFTYPLELHKSSGKFNRLGHSIGNGGGLAQFAIFLANLGHLELSTIWTFFLLLPLAQLLTVYTLLYTSSSCSKTPNSRISFRTISDLDFWVIKYLLSRAIYIKVVIHFETKVSLCNTRFRSIYMPGRYKIGEEIMFS